MALGTSNSEMEQAIERAKSKVDNIIDKIIL